jgi:hypothetical protein
MFAQSEYKKIYSLGITKDIFEEVNVRDAEVTLKLWGKLLTNNIKDVEDLKIKIYDDLKMLMNDANENKIDVLYISSLLYTKNQNKINLDPLISTNTVSKNFYDINLCTNSSNNFKEFKDLQNSTIIVQGGKYKSINELWLDLLCLEAGIKDKKGFFKKIEYIEKPIQAVLPTFLKQVDFCIVNSVSLEIISEMNPQVLKSLKIFNSRKNILNDLICINKNSTVEERKLFESIALNFGNLPKNEQINTIFKTAGARKFKQSDVDGIKSLIEDYNKLSN